MPGTLKRKSVEEDAVQPAMKRTAYEQLSKAELVDTVLDLESQVANLQERLIKSTNAIEKVKEILTPTRGNASPSPVWSEAEIAETTTEIANRIGKGISKQMKWKADMPRSCKLGTTRWYFETVVPNVKVMQRILGSEDRNGKAIAWKRKKIPKADLENVVGHISASCRYDYDLRITSEMIKVKWDEETKMLSFYGTYGF